MNRRAAIALFVGLSALAYADVPAGPSPSQQSEQLHRHRELLTVLVESSVDLSNHLDPLERAAITNRVVRRFVAALGTVPDTDAERVQELGQHLRTVLTDSLTQNVNAARANIKSGSQREQRFVEVCDETLGHLRALELATESAGESKRGRELRSLWPGLDAPRAQVREKRAGLNAGR
jgi:hypothetical protein